MALFIGKGAFWIYYLNTAIIIHFYYHIWTSLSKLNRQIKAKIRGKWIIATCIMTCCVESYQRDATISIMFYLYTKAFIRNTYYHYKNISVAYFVDSLFWRDFTMKINEISNWTFCLCLLFLARKGKFDRNIILKYFNIIFIKSFMGFAFNRQLLLQTDPNKMLWKSRKWSCVGKSK